MTPSSFRRHILVHDYAGHPFTAELSRGLAARGHRVTHAFFAADEGPKGRNKSEPGDPEELSFRPIAIDSAYSKSDFRARRRGDLEYGRRCAALIEELRPDIVLSGNTPTESQSDLVRACTRTGAQFVYWCQDFYSIAAARILARKVPVLGRFVGAWYTHLERSQMRCAAHVIHITDAFCAQTDAWGIPRDRVSVIPNWGALDQIPQCDHDNAWTARQGLEAGTRFLYSGTLALKHNPELLAALARTAAPSETVVVVSAGVGADRLAAQAEALPALRLLPLQPFDALPDVLGAADVLLVVIERDAGAFSVPSKMLSYLCAGRPVVLAAPDSNLAARILQETGAGTVVAPEDIDGFVAAARAYAADPARSAAAGRAGRAYAETHFDLSMVAARFETIFDRLAAAGRAP
ncbi:glycosyltransferase [Puniceibacterium sp. IMCC21224]|uniref:glycosyltransferase n=1 Tax=Puniceibacterium sp. IMCC21224 TaxID=1618204 RepID=UPI00064DA3CF|nr:glycosyltransferase [Puniceibacterium sp. IMCC21224]KMK63834.1 Glycosyl transferase 4-like domain/Glycosyl transferases group 1 [Puniceibacterium sp. IMCC21224]